MHKLLLTLLLTLLVIACSSTQQLQRHARKFQQSKDYQHLQQVLTLLPEEIDTAYVKKLLGEPIDMGFDYRYLTDSVSPQGCAVGAVFHIDEYGQIDQRWLDEICE